MVVAITATNREIGKKVVSCHIRLAAMNLSLAQGREKSRKAQIIISMQILGSKKMTISCSSANNARSCSTFALIKTKWSRSLDHTPTLAPNVGNTGLMMSHLRTRWRG